MSEDQPLSGLRILIVEDEFVVAAELAAAMERLGAIVTASVGTLPEACREAAQPLDGVLLDVQLGSDKTHTLADRLDAAGIPFILTTGFDAGVLPQRLQDRPRLSKPFSPPALKRMATSVFRNRP